MSTMYCGDNCNHTGPHHYPPQPPALPAEPAGATGLDVERLARAIAEIGERHGFTFLTHAEYAAAIGAAYDRDGREA